jgi:hypothetical protein
MLIAIIKLNQVLGWAQELNKSLSIKNGLFIELINKNQWGFYDFRNKF